MHGLRLAHLGNVPYTLSQLNGFTRPLVRLPNLVGFTHGVNRPTLHAFTHIPVGLRAKSNVYSFSVRLSGSSDSSAASSGPSFSATTSAAILAAYTALTRWTKEVRSVWYLMQGVEGGWVG